MSKLTEEDFKTFEDIRRMSSSAQRKMILKHSKQEVVEENAYEKFRVVGELKDKVFVELSRLQEAVKALEFELFDNEVFFLNIIGTYVEANKIHDLIKKFLLGRKEQ